MKKDFALGTTEYLISKEGIESTSFEEERKAG